MSIILDNISKLFSSNEALRDINLEIESKKTTVLIGPSGCGKSTLIRILTGLIKSDSGQVYIDDQILTTSSLRNIRLKIGYVIQEGGLFPHLTAEENVSLLAGYLGLEKQRISKRIQELAELTKFPREGFTKFPAELSGGQRQRVSLMRALMLDPEFLFLDEPLGALDPLIRYDLQTDLREIFRTLKKTVLMVTHDLNEAVFFADKIVLMKDGLIIQQGDFNSLKSHPSDPFVSSFIRAQRSVIEF
jgi:osmoprotectant transport system ATP-binding protein